MTTPVRGKSLTTRPRPVVPMAAAPAVSTPAPPPPPIIPPTPAPPKGPSPYRRLISWVSIQRILHPLLWWCSVIAICLTSGDLLLNAVAKWPAFQGYFICFAIFWITCIGMLPIVAIYRTGVNVAKEIFGHD